MALYFHAFFQWCSNEDGVANVDERFWQELADTHAAFSNHNNAVDLSKLSILFREQLSPLFTAFSEFCCKSSPMFRFCEMFLRAVEIILMNVRTERDGNWLLHLQSVSLMLPYFFDGNNTNYASWTPVYLMDLMNLPDDIQEEFMSGKFAIKQTFGVFNGQWSDIATKKTIIKDLRGSGGIIGLTNQTSALLRWTFTRHILARFSSEM
jgi:hypothetical protein